jgi:hypothetical protein
VVAVVGYIVGGWARIQREKRRAKA